jgi:hypothetical protein
MSFLNSSLVRAKERLENVRFSDVHDHLVPPPVALPSSTRQESVAKAGGTEKRGKSKLAASVTGGKEGTIGKPHSETLRVTAGLEVRSPPTPLNNSQIAFVTNSGFHRLKPFQVKTMPRGVGKSMVRSAERPLSATAQRRFALMGATSLPSFSCATCTSTDCPRPYQVWF